VIRRFLEAVAIAALLGVRPAPDGTGMTLDFHAATPPSTEQGSCHP